MRYSGQLIDGSLFPIKNFVYKGTYKLKDIPSLEVFDEEGFYRIDRSITEEPLCYILYRSEIFGLLLATNLQFLMDGWVRDDGLHSALSKRGGKEPVIYKKITPIEILFLW